MVYAVESDFVNGTGGNLEFHCDEHPLALCFTKDGGQTSQREDERMLTEKRKTEGDRASVWNWPNVQVRPSLHW